MYLLGIDLGTSSVKVSVVDAQTQLKLHSVIWPGKENAIISPSPGWAEQAPSLWWKQVQEAIRQCHFTGRGKYDPSRIAAIGVAYQMHGLVLVDKDREVLRNAIIWCDSRAVDQGERAFRALGEEFCLGNLLNSPGNFTAAKLAWVKEQEPEVYALTDRVMLPGDYISMCLTGELTASASGLSEGVLYDFVNEELSDEVLSHFGFDRSLFAPVRPVFGVHGLLRKPVAERLGLRPGIPVSYKAGDQPNNALSLNVLNPGETAATAGTSGVIYGVSGGLFKDPLSRVNSFAHVNHGPGSRRVGVLLCLNATGRSYSWVRSLFGAGLSYQRMNALAAEAPEGAAGLFYFPFGNGAERVLGNRVMDGRFYGIDSNRHGQVHLFRAVLEGIAYSFRYGLDVMRQGGMQPSVIRAGKANLFLSELFGKTFSRACHLPVELFAGDGSVGAALGAGIGSGIFHSPQEAFCHTRFLCAYDEADGRLEERYLCWKGLLEASL